MKRNSIVFITGPTATGKTAFSEFLSPHLPIEVVNGDVGQFYTPLSIGTAKPDLNNVLVPHHLFNLFNTPCNFSAASYNYQVVAIVHDIWRRGNIPVVVGGSFFYLKSLFFSLESEEEANFDVSIPDFSEIETTLLWKKLEGIDPERAAVLHPNDRYRIVRALTLWYKTGGLPSRRVPQFNPLCDQICLVGVTRERDDLYARIDQRVLEMIDAGWIDETLSLSAEWYSFLEKKRLIGYPEIINWIRAGCLPEQKKSLVEDIQKNTRNYAKRQKTFMKKFLMDLKARFEVAQTESLVIEANLTLFDVPLYIEQITEWTKQIDRNGRQRGVVE